jgi:DNA-binding NtrC family response regulator
VKPLLGRTLLVVEDEMLIFLMIEQIMMENGCSSVKIASSLQSALALIHSSSFDAATLDLNLNGVKSFPVADALQTRRVPFLFMTGYGSKIVESRHSSRPVVVKPFNERRLMSALGTILVPPNPQPVAGV